MKMTQVILSLALIFSVQSLRAEHVHANHGMVVTGINEITASHIVNVVPHNWQVILDVDFPKHVRNAYLESKTQYPKDRVILVLKNMDIGKIESAGELTATMLREDAEKNKITLVEELRLAKDDYKVLFVKELPLSLKP